MSGGGGSRRGAGIVWGTRGRGFESRHSDHLSKENHYVESLLWPDGLQVATAVPKAIRSTPISPASSRAPYETFYHVR